LRAYRRHRVGDVSLRRGHVRRLDFRIEESARVDAVRETEEVRRLLHVRPVAEGETATDQVVSLFEVESLQLCVRTRKERAIGRAPLGCGGAPRLDDLEVTGIVFRRDRDRLLERELRAAGGVHRLRTRAGDRQYYSHDA